jgi:hypothetical protein
VLIAREFVPGNPKWLFCGVPGREKRRFARAGGRSVSGLDK